MDLKSADARSIPAVLNLAASIISWGLAATLLYAASHAGSLLEISVAAVIFSFVGNTIFALLHESTHGVLHPAKWVNDLLGIVSAAFFPTGYLFQRTCHLGHHARNRTELETFDYIYPDDSRLLKTLQWYCILTPLYWLTVQAGWVVYAVCPWLLRLQALRSSGSAVVEHTSGAAYLRGMDAIPPVRARLEIAFSVAFQVALFALLDLSWQGWLACYLAFAFNWSALQYTDHAFSPLDVQRGAWDLRVPRWWRWIYLNYHCHRAHHLHPHVSWLHLPRYVDESVHRPSFFLHYLRMWKGPEPAPAPPARAA